MKDQATRQSYTSHLLTVLSFGLFALCIVAVLLSGAQAYRRLTVRDRQQYTQRTCTQYLANKVRQASDSVKLSSTTFGEGDALLLCEDLDGVRYSTVIYCSGGWLRELFTDDLQSVSPEDGEAVFEAQLLTIKLQEGLLSAKIDYEAEGSSQIVLALRDGEVLLW